MDLLLLLVPLALAVVAGPLLAIARLVGYFRRSGSEALKSSILLALVPTAIYAWPVGWQLATTQMLGLLLVPAHSCLVFLVCWLWSSSILYLRANMVGQRRSSWALARFSGAFVVVVTGAAVACSLLWYAWVNRLAQPYNISAERIENAYEELERFPALREFWFKVTFQRRHPFEAIAMQPKAPASVLESLHRRDDPKLIRRLAAHENTPPYLLDEYARSGEFDVTLAHNESTPDAWFQSMELRLAQSSSEQERYSISRASRASEGTLRMLAEDASAYVRSGVALNQVTPADVLARLSSDAGARVRRSVALNRSTPLYVLEDLQGDSDPEVSRAAGSMAAKRASR